MKPPAIVRKVAALCLLMASNATSATVLTLPTSNAYALDLQSACASDPGCQPQAGLPVASSPSQIADQAIVPALANGMSGFTSSFAAGSTVDDVFQSPAGSQSTTYPNMPTYVIDAADKFAGDEEFKWKVKLRLLQTYTNMRALVSLIEMNQDNARDVGNIVSGQYHEVSTAGTNAGYAAGGTAPGLSTLCVASNGSYNTIGASNQRDCPTGSIYVSTNRSASMAEYVAYSQSLSNVARAAANPRDLHSADTRYSRNEPGPKQYQHCSECDVDQTGVPEPGLLEQVRRWLKEPIFMLLLGLGGGAALLADAVVKGRR